MLYGLSTTVRYPAGTAEVVRVVEVHLPLLSVVAVELHRVDHILERVVKEIHSCLHLAGDAVNWVAKLLFRKPVAQYAVDVVPIKRTAVHLFKALAKQRVSPRQKSVAVTDSVTHGIQAAAAEPCGHPLRPGIVMFGVSPVGQHHIGRGIEGLLVQYCIGGHKVGIDIQQLVVARQFQPPFPAVVVGIVAIVSVIHCGVHTVRSTRSRATAVFRPEEEASCLKHFAWLTHAHLTKVSCFIPAHIIKHSILIVEHALHGVRLVLIAIAVAGFHIAFFAECNASQRCPYFLTGYFNSENKGVNPHGFRAVYPFGFIIGSVQLVTFFSKDHSYSDFFKYCPTIVYLRMKTIINYSLYSSAQNSMYDSITSSLHGIFLLTFNALKRFRICLLILKFVINFKQSLSDVLIK